MYVMLSLVIDFWQLILNTEIDNQPKTRTIAKIIVSLTNPKLARTLTPKTSPPLNLSGL